MARKDSISALLWFNDVMQQGKSVGVHSTINDPTHVLCWTWSLMGVRILQCVLYSLLDTTSNL